MSGDSSLGIGIGLALKSYGRAFRGLLNQYPGAAAAYSLRALNGNGDNVVRVRRASDNDEKDFTASQVSSGEMVNWVTEESATADGFVATWYDQSGNGNDATQSVAASQPKIVDAGTYLGELDFNGVGDELFTSSNIGITGSQSRSIFASLDPSSNSSKYFLHFGVFLPGQSWSLTPELAVRIAGGNEVYSVSDADLQLVTNILPDSSSNVTDSKMYSNGIELTATSSLSLAIDTADSVLSIGSSPLSSVALYEGSIKEIVIYPSDQSANREAIEANINNHYNIYS